MAVEKLYESENYLLVNKPYDMYINSDDENEKNTVTYNIASQDSHLSTSANPLHFVQRLDYATSGVLCIAKNKRAAALAGKLFEKRLTRKYYIAIVRDHVASEMSDIEYRVGVDPLTAQSSHRMLALNQASVEAVLPRSAHTRLLKLETGYYDGEPVTVVLLKPITGRRHQLRVHCAAIGHTVLGDYTYSNTVDKAPHRMFLHATRLVLPVPKESLDIRTPVPFFSEPELSAKWKSDRVTTRYKNREEFAAACQTLDQSYVLGAQYKRYTFDQ